MSKLGVSEKEGRRRCPAGRTRESRSSGLSAEKGGARARDGADGYQSRGSGTRDTPSPVLCILHSGV